MKTADEIRHNVIGKRLAMAFGIGADMLHDEKTKSNKMRELARRTNTYIDILLRKERKKYGQD